MQQHSLLCYCRNEEFSKLNKRYDAGKFECIVIYGRRRVSKTTIPVELQGRVYACRNTLQFFTIPIGLFLGGLMVDEVCEPLMASYGNGSVLNIFFGTEKGSGAALNMFLLGVSGVLICILTGRRLKHIIIGNNVTK